MWVELMDLLSTPCYPPIMGEFKKGWGTPPNPQQEKTLLHLFLYGRPHASIVLMMS